MAIGFIQKAKNGEKSLREILHKHLSGYQDGRDIKVLHASEVTKHDPDFCARRKAILVKLGMQNPDEFLSTSLAVTFRLGRDIERDVIEWFAEIGMAVGNWKCEACGTVHKFQKRPKTCTSCSGRLFEYKEWRAVSSVTGISCGIDLLIDRGNAKLRPIEIKTIDKEEFKKIIMPLAEHKARSRLYLKCIAESTDPFANRVDSDEIEVLYVSKGGFGVACDEVDKWSFPDNKFSPFKPFHVDRDDKSIETYHDKAVEYETFLQTGKIPCRTCPTTFHPEAKKCKQMIPCFSGEY